MGPIGYPGPPPFVSQDDEQWPPQHWSAGAAGPALPPELTGPPAPEEPFPPPHWQVGDPNAQLGGSVQPSSEMPVGEPPAGVLAQQHQPLAPPPPVAAPKRGKQASGAPGAPAAPANPYITGIEATADAKSQAVDKDAAAKQAEAEFRSERGQGAYMSQALAMRQADDDYAAAKKAGKEKTQALAKEVDDLSKSKIDRNRVFADQNTGERILTWASLFAGGMQSAFTGHNLALEAMNRILDRDFEQQKEDLATRKEALGMKRSMLSEELANGKDEYEARVKHTLMGYDLALKAIDTEAGKFQSPQIQAAAQEKKAEIQGAALDKLQELGRYTEEKAFQQRNADRQNALGWYNAKTGRMGAETQAADQKSEAAARKAAAEAKAAGREFPIYGAGGPKAGPVGYSKDKETAGKAEVMLQAQGELKDLYEEGRKLFADDYAVKGTKRRTEQDAWNTKWKNANFRAATGRVDAPSAGELDAFAIDTSAMMGEHKDRLDASYNTARTGVPGRLRALGVDDATLEAQGIIDPPEAPTPGVEAPIVFFDEKTKSYNRDGRGTPLSPEQSAHVLANPDYAVQQKGEVRGVFYDVKTKSYNTRGIGEKLSPSAEAQVRADPSIRLNAAPAEQGAPMMTGQGMPGTSDDADWSVVEPKYRPKGWKPKDKR
jgi:hypothetical protein